jgi:LmbE family N-acetylglucosaminyl deacetylase
MRFLLAAVWFAGIAWAQEAARQGPIPAPDDRYKADILVVVAHPDDETMVTGYLARAIYDLGKHIAVVFGTRGDGGGNALGNEQAGALGAVREIEARRALATLGVFNVWFLDGRDTPGQDVLRSLETWNHGNSLGQLVRLYRLTRPEVVLTWLPAYTAGENHGDHQAAGAIATEAFDIAGDPTQFAEQVAAPRDRGNISNLTEGLQPWQAKKLYFFSDSSHTDFLEGKGPIYSTLDESPARRQPYYRIAAEEMRYHLTQSDTGQMAARAIEKGDFHYFQQPVRLIFGKSVVGGAATADLFAGLTSAPAPFAPHPPYSAAAFRGTRIRLGGPWAFYRDFQPVHGLSALARLLPEAEVAVDAGSRLQIPVLLENGAAAPVEVVVTAAGPARWKVLRGPGRYQIAGESEYPLYVIFDVPGDAAAEWYEVRVQAKSAGGAAIGDLRMRVHIERGALPQ